MCVIIDKNPGSEVPFELLLKASVRNSDGYGIITIDRGKVEVRKALSLKPGVTADLIAKHLEQAKDLRVLAHLRYKTHGAISSDNLHPFPVLGYDDFGTDMWLMHNGVINDYGWDKTEVRSDTSLFVEDIVRPLAVALGTQNGPDAVLEDPLFKSILSKYAGGGSRLSLVDDKGKVLHINQNSGKVFSWGWASNEYSFTGQVSKRDWEEAGRKIPVVTHTYPALPKPSTTGASYTLPNLPAPKGVNDKASEIVQASGTLDTIADYNPLNRVDICTVLDINGLEELHPLDEHQWLRIVKEEPEVAVLALIDLTYFHYQTVTEAAKGTTTTTRGNLQ